GENGIGRRQMRLVRALEKNGNGGTSNRAIGIHEVRRAPIVDEFLILIQPISARVSGISALTVFIVDDQNVVWLFGGEQVEIGMSIRLFPRLERPVLPK